MAILNIVFIYGLDSAYLKFASFKDIGDDKDNFSTPYISVFTPSLLTSFLIIINSNHAEAPGAIAVIVANNTGDSILTMAGEDPAIAIPSVFVGQSDGLAIAAGIPDTKATVRRTDHPPLQRDGDLDADIVWHEYGHGLTWRMIGSMSGPLAGAVGEGVSDWLSILVNEDDVVGEYSYDDPGGIRRFPYTDYPLTYGDVTGAEVHDDGEVYAAIGWRLWQIFRREGLSRDLLLDYTVDGMNYTPRVNLIAGRWGDAEGPIRSLTGVYMSTVELARGGSVDFADLGGRNVFLYVVRGRIDIGGASVAEHSLVELHDDGDRLAIRALDDAVLLFGHAQPIGEPVVAHGPFVMNTREEITQAIRDYQAGLFDIAPSNSAG